MPKDRHPPLNVFINSRLVGQWRRSASGATEFQYDAGWLAWTFALPVSLSLPLREDAYSGDPVATVFEGLLPDNRNIREQIATRMHAWGTDAYSLLSAIGRDCVGALQFLQADQEPGKAGEVKGTPIDDREIARLIAGLGKSPLGVDRDEDFRISIAGAQEKTALLFWQDRWYRPEGATATTHILKPAIGMTAGGLDLTLSVENEYLCLKILGALGIPTAEASMQSFGGQSVLVVERFDRRWTADQRLLRLPQEDCCQALSIPPIRKYETDGGPGVGAVVKFLRGSDTPGEDQARFFKAIIAFWLLGATDGHAKNFSVFLSPGGRYQMTPIYDVMSGQPNVDANQIRHNKFKLAMAIGDNRHWTVDEIAPRHFVQSAKRAGVGARVINAIFDELGDIALREAEKTVESLPSDFPGELCSSILNGIRKRLASIALRKAAAV